MNTPKVLALSAAVGALAGLRAFTPPAVLSHAVRRNVLLRRSPLKLLATARLSKGLTSMAAGELVTDKLPFTPSRLKSGPLAARMASGAVCGTALCISARESVGKGAALGAVGALAGALAGYHLRQRLDREMPDFTVALVEDAIAVGGSIAVVYAL
jgi:uncharacterized membrane protein